MHACLVSLSPKALVQASLALRRWYDTSDMPHFSAVLQFTKVLCYSPVCSCVCVLMCVIATWLFQKFDLRENSS